MIKVKQVIGFELSAEGKEHSFSTDPATGEKTANFMSEYKGSISSQNLPNNY
jgi:hypothetical protein